MGLLPIGTRRQADKRLTLAQAATLVQPDMMLALGGMTLYRRPMAFVRALLARPDRPADLTLLCFTAGLESDLLVGAGLVRTVRTCYFGLEIFGFAPCFSEQANRGEITIIEETETSIAAGLRAALSGIPFLPSAAWLGTDLPRLRPDVQSIIDPYSGQNLIAFPAIRPDVVVIHALVADHAGNFRLNNNWGVDKELALVSPIVIVTAEQVVERLTEDITVAGPTVTAVVEAPGGAFPTSCYPLYPVGGGELLRYIDACNAGQFERYLIDSLSNEGLTYAADST